MAGIPHKRQGKHQGTRILLCQKMQNREFIVTLHALEEMDQDGFSISDVVNCICNGRVFTRQKDRDTGEWKYIIQGQSLDERPMEVVAKLGIDSKAVIITAYAIDE